MARRARIIQWMYYTFSVDNNNGYKTNSPYEMGEHFFVARLVHANSSSIVGAIDARPVSWQSQQSPGCCRPTVGANSMSAISMPTVKPFTNKQRISWRIDDRPTEFWMHTLVAYAKQSVRPLFGALTYCVRREHTRNKHGARPFDLLRSNIQFDIFANVFFT